VERVVIKDEIDALREYHLRRSAQQKKNASSSRVDAAAERHLELHRLHELMCIDLCCQSSADQEYEPASIREAAAANAPQLIGASLRSVVPLCKDNAMVAPEAGMRMPMSKAAKSL
jgi:hypothetical protein